MTGVIGRLKYARQKAVKYPELEQATKTDRKAINEEIYAKTDYEQKQKRIVSVSKRFVGTAATVGLPLVVMVNDAEIARCAPSAQDVAECYTEVKDALMQFLEANKETSLKISGVLG